MDKKNINDIANKVAATLIKNPDLVEDFKGQPHNAITKISGNNNLSDSDLGNILGTLLSGSDSGGGLLGSLVGTLTKGKTTKKGEQNVVGELIKQVIGNQDSTDIMTLLIGALIKNALSNSTDKKKTGTTKTTPKTGTSTKTTGTKTTGTKTTSTKTTGTKTTTKTTGTKTTTKSGNTKSSKSGGSTDILGNIGEILDNSGIDVGDLIGTLVKNVSNKKK